MYKLKWTVMKEEARKIIECEKNKKENVQKTKIIIFGGNGKVLNSNLR